MSSTKTPLADPMCGAFIELWTSIDERAGLYGCIHLQHLVALRTWPLTLAPRPERTPVRNLHASHALPSQATFGT